MNYKERVLAAIDHVEPDRVPADLWALPPVTDNLRTHFGVNSAEGVWHALDIDLRSIWPTYIGPDLERFDDGSWLDWWGCRREMIGPFEEVTGAPLADAEMVADVEAHAWPHPDWFDVAGMRDRCQALSKYALVIRDAGPHATCVLREAMYLRGMERFMMDLALEPTLAQAIIAHVEAFYLELDRRIFEAVGNLTDIYFIADDVGVQNGLMISPKAFHKFVQPSLTRFIEQAHRYHQKVMYHTCGAVRRLIPDFIEMGVDILNPIQVSAKGMNPAELKRDFGDALCFHGALDIQTILSQGTPGQVRDDVKRLCDVLGPGGGFILAPTNNVMPETPMENLVVMYETVQAAGRYR
ncbi:MAG: uroporphyrinogen decarboxylase family protein [Anaerolineae bacterium]|jgi:uroporphyrinogen decarboxylase